MQEKRVDKTHMICKADMGCKVSMMCKIDVYGLRKLNCDPNGQNKWAGMQVKAVKVVSRTNKLEHAKSNRFLDFSLSQLMTRTRMEQVYAYGCTFIYPITFKTLSHGQNDDNPFGLECSCSILQELSESADMEIR